MTTPKVAVTTDRRHTQAPTRPERTNGAANNAVKWLLRSPLHGLISKWLMLVTYTGRKSGKTYTTPVSYIKTGDGVVFFNNHAWWHNFETPSPVTLRVKGHDLRGIAEAIPDPYEIEPVVRAYLEEKGVGQAWMIGLKLQGKTMPTREELARAIADGGTIMVRVRSARHSTVAV